MTFRVLLVSAVVFAAAQRASAEAQRFDGKVVTVKPWLSSAAYGYTLRSIETKSELKWAPNTRAATGIDFYFHGFFGFGVGGLSELKSEDRLLKGDTTYSDYRFSFAFRSFQIIANYQQFHGFYLENTEFVNPSRLPSDPYYQQPDMTSQNASVLFTWIMDPSKYSLEAATDQSVRQNSSGGSWLVGGSVAQARFNNTTALVPTAVAGQFGADSGVTSADFTSVTVRGGYGHTFCWGTHWFGTLQGMLGLGTQVARYYDTTNHDDSQVIAKSDFLISTGYNGDQFLGGLMIDLDITNYRTRSLEIPVTLGTIKLYAGTRF
jgi:hypothetical protein